MRRDICNTSKWAQRVHDAPQSEQHCEEFSCDAFATTFLLEHADDYAVQHNVLADQVRRKRRFALFAMTLATKNQWDASPTHPAVQDRIDATVRLFGNRESEFFRRSRLCGFLCAAHDLAECTYAEFHDAARPVMSGTGGSCCPT
jgi:hypothetical protein